jgi:hypothetical protein
MLVIVEKPVVANAVHAHLAALFPTEQFTYLAANAFGWPFVFDFPTKLSWHEYPVWHDASYRLNPKAQWQMTQQDGKLMRSQVDYLRLMRQDVITIADASRSAILATNRLVKHLQMLGKVDTSHGYRVLTSLVGQDIAKALTTPISEELVSKTCLAAQLKSDFEFSFLVNASGLLTRSFYAAAGEHPNPVFSKYTMQVLYALNEMGPQAEGQVHTRLRKWKGTGRYPEMRASMGSAASRQALLDNLVQLGLATRSMQGPQSLGDKEAPSTVLSLTSLGSAFLDKLHPDCEDPDLPFRLELWMEEPGAGRATAQRYLRTWFGKQKRFMSKMALPTS